LLLAFAQVTAVLSHRVRRLAGKYGYGVLNRFRLVLLDFKLEFHKNFIFIEYWLHSA
jgi:hypothetical protein